ncbi:miniconductance mechanosensitive channel [Paenibacillus turicensis]|uniref:Miniconductance mechanosensitive channel n=1 Tax=Paenibacillus turicensis TaxID=160487 RepID=A0ABS4FRE3_9BACL|nr:mechanosensitive ion channel domain-containing protein [Paenibacillus turicensis]MBP1905135.1 miniconductance mechanosensitive channel [Paenibacillus turicensis]
MDFIKKTLEDFGVEASVGDYLSTIIFIIFVIVVSLVAKYIAKKITLKFATRYVSKSSNRWSRYFLERKIFQRLTHYVPAIILYYFSYSFPSYQGLLIKLVIMYMIIVTIIILDALLNVANDIYTTFEVSKVRPIRGYIQVIKIFIFMIGGILVISNLMGQSPVILLSGIGALSAVVMLVFKDSILGLVAGIQLTSNDMLRVGDWIEMPKYDADGSITDISLNTVKIQNWDKTITTIPTYAMISDSFKNWRGMQNSGGRRIKRSIYIDTNSISFCTSEMIEDFKKIQYLQSYISTKQKEIDDYNVRYEIDRSSLVNGRALTNIGVFRAYIQAYLEKHPGIHKEMTLMVRQLAPQETGLPIEIYAFTNKTEWAVYEGIQADIFDHIIAIAPSFGLRIFQNPTGHDFRSEHRSDSTSPSIRGEAT